MGSYVESSHLSYVAQAVRAGIHGRPETRTKMGVLAVGKIVFTGAIIAGDTVTVNGVTFTCMASGATGELQFDVGGSLSLSLDALITKLNACTDARVSYATYTKTDTNTAVTSTSDAYSYDDNDKLLSSTHATVVVTQPTGGSPRLIGLDTMVTVMNLPGSTTEVAYLTDGVEGQMKLIVMAGSGTVNLTGANIAATNYAFNGADALLLVFAGGKWRVVTNDGVTAT